jgi:hypothetical protein
MTVSRATEERERESEVEKLLSAAKESAGPEILGRGTECETRHYRALLPFPICEMRLVSVLLQYTCATWLRSLVPPHLLEVILTGF